MKRLFLALFATSCVCFVTCVDKYEIIINDKKETCKNSPENVLQKKTGFTLNKCKELCDNDDDCLYIWFSKVNWCITFEDCDINNTIPIIEKGTTYERIDLDKDINEETYEDKQDCVDLTGKWNCKTEQKELQVNVSQDGCIGTTDVEGVEFTVVYTGSILSYLLFTGQRFNGQFAEVNAAVTEIWFDFFVCNKE